MESAEKQFLTPMADLGHPDTNPVRSQRAVGAVPHSSPVGDKHSKTVREEQRTNRCLTSTALPGLRYHRVYPI